MTLTDIKSVIAVQSNLRATFETAHGREVMKLLEHMGGWIPTVFDSSDTNEIIARDANRRLIGTIKTLLECSPEQIVALAKKEEKYG